MSLRDILGALPFPWEKLPFWAFGITLQANRVLCKIHKITPEMKINSISPETYCTIQIELELKTLSKSRMQGYCNTWDIASLLSSFQHHHGPPASLEGEVVALLLEEAFLLQVVEDWDQLELRST